MHPFEYSQKKEKVENLFGKVSGPDFLMAFSVYQWLALVTYSLQQTFVALNPGGVYQTISPLLFLARILADA